MLTMKAKYALRALDVLARLDRASLPAHEIAARAQVPERFLETILAELRRGGFVSSRRGLQGGHTLARSPESIALGDVIRCIDGPLAPIRCASVTAYRACDDCPDPGACSVRRAGHRRKLAAGSGGAEWVALPIPGRSRLRYT